MSCNKFWSFAWTGKYLTNDFVQILNLNNILINFNKTKKSRCFGHFAIYFWLMIIHITIFFLLMIMMIMRGKISCSYLDVFRTGSEYYSVLQMTIRNRLQFDNSVPLVIFLIFRYNNEWIRYYFIVLVIV